MTFHVPPTQPIIEDNIIYPRVWVVRRELEEGYGRRFIVQRATLYGTTGNIRALEYHYLLRDSLCQSK